MTEAAAPQATGCEGAAFPLSVRLMATAFVGTMLYWGARSATRLWETSWATSSALLLAGAVCLVLWCLVWIWRSRTRVDAQGVEQSWIWRKHVRWADVAQARLIGVPGLEWLIAPRLVVRPRGGGIVVFHSADRRVLAAFASFVSIGVPLLDGQP
jgi:hypothetical protein